jgi:YjbE family integral membrane protein
MAILLRVLLTLVATAVLQIPLLKLIGGLALVFIAIRLMIGDAPSAGDDLEGAGPEHIDLTSVIATVVVADLVMSMDNVIALAAVAKGSVLVLVLGLVLSVPLLMFGSWHVSALLQRYGILTPLGGILLGWVAGDIAVSDPLYASWIEQQSPALGVFVPMLVAAYVLLQSRIIARSRASAAALRPARRRKPLKIELVRTVAEAAAYPTSEAAVQMMASNHVELDVPEATPPTGPITRAEAQLERPQPDTLPAAPAAQPSLEQRRRAKPGRWVAIAGAGVAAAGAIYGLMSFRLLPQPAEPIRYDCPAKDVSLYFRPGGQRIRITNGAATVNGVVQHNNQIDWGDYHMASSALGFVPPTRVMFGNAQSLRVDGGMFADVTCTAHASAVPSR